MKFKLFLGLLSGILCFNGNVESLLAKDLVPGGENIAIEVRADGLLVTGTYDVKYGDNKVYNPAKDSDIKRKDLIYSMNGEKVTSMKDLPNVFKNISSMEATVEVKLKRDGKNLTRELKLIKSTMTGNWKSGLLVKERILGIGTVTFYDPETNMYGALGHQLNDNDYGDEVDLSYGNIYQTYVVGIHKSEDGKPGEKVATVYENIKLGSVTENTPYGIFGYADEIPDREVMETAEMDEVELGEAEMWTVIYGNVVEKFSINIIDLKKQKEISTKGITFEITDERLLNKTNGIVQGMSGSPIIQNNKIVGAVTHVFVDDVTKGYGIYIDWMLEQIKA